MLIGNELRGSRESHLLAGEGLGKGSAFPRSMQAVLEQIAFKTPAPALTAQVNYAYAYAAASHADAWLVEHFQKQNALGPVNAI
ncbi:hypothetical protein [Desulfocurvibacter africanus]|uniref:hypothetical protein n=1 Tax=Desulfocurvibacter africanus TaxID=873 RepID=UPI00040513C7|nr:hypothetical protein [Desulfocurvibacter africanus]